jgi:hypothetical protein
LSTINLFPFLAVSKMTSNLQITSDEALRVYANTTKNLSITIRNVLHVSAMTGADAILTPEQCSEIVKNLKEQ